jgi:hypothetical protein
MTVSDIHIAGLSALQRDLADHLWRLDTLRDIDTWMATLPRRMQRQARTVQHMIIAAELDTVMEVTDEVCEYLRSR